MACDLRKKVIDFSRGRVIHGPFLGMHLDGDAISWGDGDLVRKLLGVYEEELHEVINFYMANNPKRVVNVGCAEGYYSVGLALKMPNTKVVAVDTSPHALICTEKNSNLNEVVVETRTTPPEPEAGDLWIVDIEGAELELLLGFKWSFVDILVELHEWVCRGMKERFDNLFVKTHEIQTIRQGSRDPNRFDFLFEFSDAERWGAMSENRPEMMRWMWMRPRTGQQA